MVPNRAADGRMAMRMKGRTFDLDMTQVTFLLLGHQNLQSAMTRKKMRLVSASQVISPQRLGCGLRPRMKVPPNVPIGIRTTIWMTGTCGDRKIDTVKISRRLIVCLA